MSTRASEVAQCKEDRAFDDARLKNDLDPVCLQLLDLRDLRLQSTKYVTIYLLYSLPCGASTNTWSWDASA